MLTIVLHILALLLRSEKLFLVSIGLNVIVVLALLVCGSLIMIPLKFLGDFCMDPHGNLLKLLSGNSNSMAEILSYYTTCSGANPFEAYAGEMNTELTNAQSTLSSFLATGYIDVQCYDMISTNCTAISMDVNSLSQKTSCDIPYGIYSSVVFGDVCTEAIVGVYEVWPIVYSVAALLLVALCVTNCVAAKHGLLLWQRPTAEMEVENEKTVRHPMFGILSLEDEEKGKSTKVEKHGQKRDLKRALPFVQAYELVPSGTFQRAERNEKCIL